MRKIYLSKFEDKMKKASNIQQLKCTEVAKYLFKKLTNKPT